MRDEQIGFLQEIPPVFDKPIRVGRRAKGGVFFFFFFGHSLGLC